MNKDLIKFVVKLFVGMVSVAAGGTLGKKAGEDAGRIKGKESSHA